MILHLSNNFFVLDGISLLHRKVYLERVMFVDGEIFYTEDYQQISLFCLFDQISKTIVDSIKKESTNEKSWGKNWNYAAKK